MTPERQYSEEMMEPKSNIIGEVLKGGTPYTKYCL